MTSGVSWRKSAFVSCALYAGCAVLLEYEIVQPGVKVNGDYYCEAHVLLKEKLFAMHQGNIGDNFIFQQDSTPAHRA